MGNLRMKADQISYKGADRPMSVEEAIKNAGNTGLAHTADIAPDFSTEAAYSAGDLVYHNGTLYKFTADHAAGAWSAEDTQAATVSGEVDSLNSSKAAKADIAPDFSTATAYTAGDLVYYNGTLYVFTADHAAGAWSAVDTQAVTVGGKLSELMSGLNGVTKNAGGTSVDITGATLSDKYTFPADGYIYVSSETDTSGINKAAVLGSNGITLAYIFQPISAANDIRSLYVRKGMMFYVIQKSTNASMRFTQLT